MLAHIDGGVGRHGGEDDGGREAWWWGDWGRWTVIGEKRREARVSFFFFFKLKKLMVCLFLIWTIEFFFATCHLSKTLNGVNEADGKWSIPGLINHIHNLFNKSKKSKFVYKWDRREYYIITKLILPPF